MTTAQQQILVPIDFSPASMVALEHAARTAQQSGASIDLLYVWEPPALVSVDEFVESKLPKSILDAISGHAQDAMEALVAKAKSKGIAIRDARAIPGKPYRAIVEEAERRGYDLIVMGTHGRKPFARAFLGSVAERVVRHASCPVLIARNRPEAASGAQSVAE
jgi:nucleotide-binding universal stress UspA family protein